MIVWIIYDRPVMTFLRCGASESLAAQCLDNTRHWKGVGNKQSYLTIKWDSWLYLFPH